MKRKYKIIEAHSGNSAREIRAAKNEFRKGVKDGRFDDCQNVTIKFKDVNYAITAEFYNSDTYQRLF